jgi:hypothetical protein
MNGGWPTPVEGLSVLEQVDTLLKLLEGVIAGIDNSSGMASQQQIQGFVVLEAYIGQFLQQLSQDEQQAQAVKAFGDRLGKAMNSVKAYQQRLAEQQQQQQPDDNAAKVQAMIIQAQSKAAISQEQAKMKQRHKEMMFQSEQSRKDEQTSAEIQRQNAVTLADIRNQTAREAAKPEPEPAAAD